MALKCLFVRHIQEGYGQVGRNHFLPVKAVGNPSMGSLIGRGHGNA